MSVSGPDCSVRAGPGAAESKLGLGEGRGGIGAPGWGAALVACRTSCPPVVADEVVSVRWDGAQDWLWETGGGEPDDELLEAEGENDIIY